MKALILNSGRGKRMGNITSTHPKCLTKIRHNETILSRQLKMISDCGIEEVVITTGYMEEELIYYCEKLNLPLRIIYVNNPRYTETNYIYSLYCAREKLDDELIFMHGDLVFEEEVFRGVIQSKESCVIVSSTADIPEKDFKAVYTGNYVRGIGVDLCGNVIAVQPLYHLKRNDWKVWLEKIVEYVEAGKDNVYAEKAFNEISDRIKLRSLDVKEQLCAEIDNVDDLDSVCSKLNCL